MIASPADIRTASTPEPVRIVINTDPDELETVEIDRGIDGGVDICWQTPFSTRLIALCDAHAAATARAVLGIAEPGAVVLSASQADRLAQLAGLLDITTPCRAFYENDEIVRDLRGIAGELRRMSGRVRLVVVS